MKNQDPETDQEWQAAVDAAHFFLMLDSARLYGLVTGGPEVDTGRCEELIQEGAERGFVPSADAIERGVTELARDLRKRG